MEPFDKAKELIIKFPIFDWNDQTGYEQNMEETKKVCHNVIDEIVEACQYNMVESHNTVWWNKVRKEIEKY